MDNPDMQLGVEFFVRAVENPRESKAQKRPIFEDQEYIRIRFPADNKRELVAQAHEMHYVSHAKQQMTYAERFAARYDAFRKNHDDSLVQGTPLSELTSITAAKRAELNAMEIRTVEQLAGLPTAAQRRIGMGALSLVSMAKEYMENSKEHADIAALRRRIEELESMKAAPAPEPVAEKVAEQVSGFEEDDLRNMLRDAGVEVDGRWKRARLEKELQALAEAKENEAA